MAKRIRNKYTTLYSPMKERRESGLYYFQTLKAHFIMMPLKVIRTMIAMLLIRKPLIQVFSSIGNKNS